VVVTVVDWCRALLGKRDGWMDLAGRNFQGQPLLGADQGRCEKMSGARGLGFKPLSTAQRAQRGFVLRGTYLSYPVTQPHSLIANSTSLVLLRHINRISGIMLHLG
jgi:hypothetical protein